MPTSSNRPSSPTARQEPEPGQPTADLGSQRLGPQLATPRSSWIGTCLLGCLATLAPYSLCAQAGEWAQWRGPERNGASPGESWPESLAPDSLEIVWRAELGASYSGVVASSGAIFIAEQNTPGREQVAALDPQTGKRLWTVGWPVEFDIPRSAGHGNWPKSTPAVAGDRLYFLGIDEQLYCLDAGSGELQWRIDFPATFRTPTPEFGASSSPLVVDDLVYVQAAGSLFAIDRTSGEVRWRAHNLYDGQHDSEAELETYGSPIVATLGGVRQIVALTAKGLIGVASDSGELLWSIDVDGRFEDPPNTTPALWRESILVTSEDGGTGLYRVEAIDGRFRAEQTWQHKARSDMSSPVIVGDHAFLHLKNRRMASLDLRTGEHAWISKPGFGQYASLMSRDQKILSLSTEGELTLFDSKGDEMLVFDRREVVGDAWAHAAAESDRVYVRSLESLVALEWVRSSD